MGFLVSVKIFKYVVPHENKMTSACVTALRPLCPALAPDDLVVIELRTMSYEEEHQKKVFTNWINSKIQGRNLHVDNIFEDLKCVVEIVCYAL